MFACLNLLKKGCCKVIEQNKLKSIRTLLSLTKVDSYLAEMQPYLNETFRYKHGDSLLS